MVASIVAFIGLAHDAELPLQVPCEVCDLAASEIIEARDLHYRNERR